MLPAYMIPTRIVVLSELPLSENGKVDRNAVRKAVEGQTADSTSSASSTPVDALEEHLCDIWAQILAVPRMGRHDDFFRSGGDSLKATRIMSELTSRQLVTKNMSLRTLISAPTVATFAEQVRFQQHRETADFASADSTTEEGTI